MTKVVSVHLSPFAPYEQAGLRNAIGRAQRFMVNSRETAQSLAVKGVPERRIINFHNACHGAYCVARETVSPTLRRLLVVSNHVPTEVQAALRLLRTREIESTVIGVEGSQQRVTRALLHTYDAVLSIGRTVQYGLLSNTPVYCYDHFGGPGWLSTENFSRAEAFNFSGRCCGVKRDAPALVADLIEGFSKAQQFHAQADASLKERYSLQRYLKDCLSLDPNDRVSAQEMVDVDVSEPITHLTAMMQKTIMTAQTARQAARASAAGS